MQYFLPFPFHWLESFIFVVNQLMGFLFIIYLAPSRLVCQPSPPTNSACGLNWSAVESVKTVS